MPGGYSDALRGYAYRVHRRDGFRCVYCGLDGARWPGWLYLSWDHLLPREDPQRDDEQFIVTACRICNEYCNRTRFDVEGRTPDEIVAMKCEAIASRRLDYEQFFKEHVAGAGVPNGVLQTRAEEGMVWVEKLLAAEAVVLEGSVRSRIPEHPGIYAFSFADRPLDVLRAGRAMGAGGLRQRVYNNHLMGNQGGNLRAQLVRAGWCESLDDAKNWIRANCEVRFAVAGRDTDLRWIEHFMLAVLRPEFSN